MAVRSVQGNKAQGLSPNRDCKISATTEDNIPRTDPENSYFCIYCLNILNAY